MNLSLHSISGAILKKLVSFVGKQHIKVINRTTSLRTNRNRYSIDSGKRIVIVTGVVNSLGCDLFYVWKQPHGNYCLKGVQA